MPLNRWVSAGLRFSSKYSSTFPSLTSSTRAFSKISSPFEVQPTLPPIPANKFTKKKERTRVTYTSYYSDHDFHPLEQLHANDFEMKKKTRKNMWYHRKPHKRANSVINHLNMVLSDEGDKKGNIEKFLVGDAVEVRFRTSMESNHEVYFRGVLIGERNRGYSSSFRVLGVVEGSPVEYIFQKYSPLISNVMVLQRSFIHKGKKRTKRAKLYYLRDRPLAEITIMNNFVKMVKRERENEAQRLQDQETTEDAKQLEDDAPIAENTTKPTTQ